jgi:predicted molibdopterin-dependent oxidoreductase YjgC
LALCALYVIQSPSSLLDIIWTKIRDIKEAAMSDSQKSVTLIIDGHEITVLEGTTMLEAAKMLGIEIPVICYHEATTANGLCRICVVDVNNGRVLQPACVAHCQDKTNVETRNERVERSRRTILEMLNSAVNLEEAPALQTMMADYEADKQRFPEARRREHPLHDDNPFYMRDYSQCVLCWRCVQVCAEDAQYTFALTFGARGFDTHISTAFDISMPDSPCVFCGQCVGVCPTGALKPKVEWGLQHGWTLDDIWKNTRQPRRRNPEED